MVRGEQLRLGRTFRRLLLLSLAAPGSLEACGSSQNQSPGGDAGLDSTTGGPDSNVDAPGEGASLNEGGAGDASSADVLLDSAMCQPSAPYYSDAGLAAEDAGADSAPRSCYYFVDFPCGTNYLTGTGAAACYFSLSECAHICTLEGGVIECLYWADAGCTDGAVTAQLGQPATIACGTCDGVGRRPAGLVKRRVPRAAHPLGEYFAQASHLEAASVHAFERLRQELRAHGAPRELVRMAGRSAADEVRHARVMARLARRHGGQVTAPKVRRGGVRSLESVALENIVEGCVRETYGAMLATWQARHAEVAHIRRCMARIARDETRHAALAWAVARWTERQLDSGARQRVARAGRKAVDALARDVSRGLPRWAAREAGLPTPDHASALVAALAEALWA